MPKAGVPQSRRRREGAAAVRESKAPTRDGRRKSPLADFLRDPTAHSERELARAAANGELTTLDMQAAIAAQIVAVRKMLPGRGRKPTTKQAAEQAAVAEAQRPIHVLIKQQVEALKDVVLETVGGGGPMVVVELHWPAEYAGADQGEDVRLRIPPGAEQ